MVQHIFPGRTLKIATWNPDPRYVSISHIELEKELNLLAETDVEVIKSIDHLDATEFDLLVVSAQHVPEQEFTKWLGGLSQRIQTQGNIWVPSLIVADLPLPVLREVLMPAINSNWYFDLISVNHISSIAIRIANLVRIHDHLRELFRYAQHVEDLQRKVQSLEDQVMKFTGGSSK